MMVKPQAKARQVKAKARLQMVKVPAKPPAKAMAKAQAVDLSKFPMGNKEYRIDASFQEPRLFKVFYWAKRPDEIHRIEGDKYHWHPDSEFSSLEEAKKRLESLKAGAKKKSILIVGG